MANSEILDNAKFWNILQTLVDMESPKNFDYLTNEFKITSNMLTSLLNFLKDVNFAIELQVIDEKLTVIPPKEKPKFTLNFTLPEWLAFQAHFPLFDANEKTQYTKKIIQKLGAFEDEYRQSDLFAPLSILEVVKDHSIEEGLSEVKEKKSYDVYMEMLETAILEEKCLKLYLKNNSQMSVLPRRIVFIDKFLSLIAEDIKDTSLIQLNIWNILDVEVSDKVYPKNYSKIQIDDFINSIMSINNLEVRLIMKIYNQVNINLEPDHVHLSNVCLVTNSQGDKIWAATVEPCEVLFEWIFSMGKDVEILDPEDIKRQYLDFCVEKIKKTG